MALQNETMIVTYEKNQLISDHIKRMLDLCIQVSIFAVTSVFGVCTNLVNIVVYWKHGLKDSITIGFFVLSLSDLVVVSCPLLTAACYAAKFISPSHPISFSAIHYVSSGWLRNMVYSLSCTLTSLLALERCCCVVFPFKVKDIFTRTKTIVVITALILFHAICFLPIFASHQLRWRVIGPGNGTWRLTVWFSNYRQEIEQFNSTLVGIILPTVAQAVVTVSAVIMVNGLRQSARFRRKAVHTNNTKHPQPLTQSDLGDCENPYVATSSKTFGAGTTTTGGTGNDIRNCNTDGPKLKTNTSQDHNKSYDEKNNPMHSMSQRDAKLTKTMVFLVAILSACNVPFITMMYARRLVPDLNIGRAYENTFSVCYSIVYVLGTINASANLSVYYVTSSRFRLITQELFCRRKKV